MMYSLPSHFAWHRLAVLLCIVAILGGIGGTVATATAQDEAAVESAEAVAEEVAGEAAAAEEEMVEEEAAVDADTLAAIRKDSDTLWTCVAAFLVFFMQAGFAMVETGFTRAKNACNILMKNLMDFAIGSLVFWALGFGLMFGSAATGFFGTDNFFFDGGDDGFNWAFLIFQTVFAATAATIVSGAMAERTKFIGYLAYSFMITLVVYPIFGCWAWNSLFSGGGWLEGKGFHDFAGSTVVHSIGGWAALAGAIVLGPRLGKFGKNGKVMPIPGHNITIAALGVFILWLGWFGFNPGSTTAVGGGVGGMAYISVTTNLAAAAGAIAAMITAWVLFGKPDPSFSLNGALAGLVAITAGCDALAPWAAALTGLVAGVIVVVSVVFFDKIRVDDPVGAVSVHGVCGAWGTLAVGLFMIGDGLLPGGGVAQLISQVTGIGCAFLWAFPVSFIIFKAIDLTIGLRVSAEEEMEGLDITEHGMLAYPPGFVADTVTGSPVASMSGGTTHPGATAVASTSGA